LNQKLDQLKKIKKQRAEMNDRYKKIDEVENQDDLVQIDSEMILAESK
jgi:hypothetical protein